MYDYFALYYNIIMIVCMYVCACVMMNTSLVYLIFCGYVVVIIIMIYDET